MAKEGNNIVKEFRKIYKELEQLKRITDKVGFQMNTLTLSTFESLGNKIITFQSLDDVLCSRFPAKSKIHGMAVKKGVVGLYPKKKQLNT